MFYLILIKSFYILDEFIIKTDLLDLLDRNN